MISYYDLLTMIKEENIPKGVDFIFLQRRYRYKASFDDVNDEFINYELRNKNDENEDIHFYLSENFLESDMFDKCIEIVDKKEDLKKEMSKLQSEIDLLSNEVQKDYSKVISNRDKVNYMKEQLKELIRMVNNED